MKEPASSEALRREFRENLFHNVMPFWMDNAWDEEYGGFLTRLDRRGRRLEAERKYLMMQVRMIAALCWTHQWRAEIDGEDSARAHGYLALARRGFDYLTATFRDRLDGGYFFSVTRDGRPDLPDSRRKNTDVHAYVLIGLSTYHRVARDLDALCQAEQVFDVLQNRARDGDRGYHEDFDGLYWGALNAEQMHLGNDPSMRIKTIDMHTNVMEAFSYLVEVTGDDRHHRELRHVRDLIVSRGIDHDRGCTITVFNEDWVPVGDARGMMTTSYGINVELAWLLHRTAGVLGDVPESGVETIFRLIDHALDYGFDPDRGGLASYGPFSGPTSEARSLPPDRLRRAWWIQAELLNALSVAIELSGSGSLQDEQGAGESCETRAFPEDESEQRSERYRTAFERQWDWIRTYQTDHECGDWYQEIDPATGRPVYTEKGREWKTAFHVARALVRSDGGRV